MMLNQLMAYAQKNLADSEPGFTTRIVRWQVEISGDGKLVNILPLGDDKKGAQTAKCPEMHNMNAGRRAHFLVETLQTVALLCKANEKDKKIVSAREKQIYFTQMVQQAATVAPVLEPLSRFVSNNEELESLQNKLAEMKAKSTDWLQWRIAGVDPLQRPEVLNWWRSWRQADQGKVQSASASKRKKDISKADTSGLSEMICFLTGMRQRPLATHPKVAGLSGVGRLRTGDVMAGFDKAAFCSFGLEQASNAAMGEVPVRQYVDGLNHLIKNHSLNLAKTLVVHWFQETIRLDDDPVALLYEPPEQTEAAAQSSARQILESLRKGEKPCPTNNRFFAMTVSGASGRVMVRDWMEGAFEELVARVAEWFTDLEIVARDGSKLAPEPKFMAVCGALVRDSKDLKELKELSAPTVTTLWQVALSGLPIPQPLIAQALSRFRTDLINDKPFNHARMGLIKAYFIRKGGNYTMSPYLNEEHPDSAYQCGRLLATLASLQHSALGDVGAGVVQRYYVAASQTPGLTFGRLVANAKNHLNKLDGGLAYWYEGQIANIMSQIENRIPATLDLEKQSLFALGYYQQIAANRAGKNNDTNETSKGDNQ